MKEISLLWEVHQYMADAENNTQGRRIWKLIRTAFNHFSAYCPHNFQQGYRLTRTYSKFLSCSIVITSRVWLYAGKILKQTPTATLHYYDMVDPCRPQGQPSRTGSSQHGWRLPTRQDRMTTANIDFGTPNQTQRRELVRIRNPGHEHLLTTMLNFKAIKVFDT